MSFGSAGSTPALAVDARDFTETGLRRGGACILLLRAMLADWHPRDRDDYGVFPGCRVAAEEYRRALAVHDPIDDIDGSDVFWRRAAA